MNENLKSKIVLILKIIFIFFILILFYRMINLSRVYTTAVNMTRFFLIGGVITVFLGIVFQAWIWKILVGQEAFISIKNGIKANTSILFINHLLPSRAAGIASSPVILSRLSEGLSMPEAGGITLTRTFWHALGYGFFSLVGLLISINLFPNWLLITLLASTTVYFFIGAIILASTSKNKYLRKLVKKPIDFIKKIPLVGRIENFSEKIDSFIAEASESTSNLLSSNYLNLRVFSLWIFAFPVLQGIRYWLLFQGVGQNFALLPLVVLPILSYSVTILPISIGGIGVAEGSATLVFTFFGIPPETAATVVFLDRVISLYIPALIGGLFSSRI